MRCQRERVDVPTFTSTSLSIRMRPRGLHCKFVCKILQFFLHPAVVQHILTIYTHVILFSWKMGMRHQETGRIKGITMRCFCLYSDSVQAVSSIVYCIGLEVMYHDISVYIRPLCMLPGTLSYTCVHDIVTFDPRSR